MKRMNNVKKTLALMLAMIMVLTSTAFANWDSFQGSDDNNGTTDINVSSSSSTIIADLPNDNASTGLDVEPLVVGSRIYAFHNGGSNGATVTAVDATNGSQLWTKVVGPEAKDVSQIATPVITEDGKTLYGTYTYTQNLLDGKTVSFSGDYADGKISANGTATATITGVTLPGGYGNLQVGTDITSTGTDQQVGTANIKNGSSVVQSFTGSSYETYNFNIYYSDGTPVPGGTYTIEVSIQNTTGSPVPWSTVSLLVNRWSMFKVTGIDGSDPTVTPVTVSEAGYAGQASTPLTLADGKVYFGIFDGDRAYYQYDTENNTAAKFKPGNNDQFYYAGAVVVDGCVIFGSESGTLYMQSAANFGTTKASQALPNAGKIRSSICYDSSGGYIYLTSQNGLLWKVKLTGSGFGAENHMSVAQGDIGNTVSTPVVSKSGLIYVGVYGYGENFAGKGYIVATNRSNVSTSSKANIVYSGDMVQCSPVVYWDGGSNTDYVYFTTNTANGTGYCYQCKYASFSVAPVWSVTPSTNNGYAVQGFATGETEDEDTFVVFGNDNCQLVIIME